MRALEKGFTTVEILLVLLIITIIGAAGAVVYSNSKKGDTSEKTSSRQEHPHTSDKKSGDTTQTPSDEEAIRDALLCASSEAGVVCEIKEKTDMLAWATKGDDYGGATYYLAKESGKWNVIYKGNGDVPQETITKYSIPQSWLGPQMDEVQ